MAHGCTSLVTSQLATTLGGTLEGSGDVTITGLNSLEDATPSDVTFITTSTYAKQWPSSKAAAAIVTEKLSSQIPNHKQRPLIVVPDVEIAMIRLLELFSPPVITPEPGVHPTAAVHPTAKLGKGSAIGAHVSIGPNCEVGNGVVLFDGVRLYPDVRIGDGCVIHSNTVIRERCVLGRGIILHQNVSIGADGFGYRPDPNGAGLLKMPHIGNVIIEDGVEIGANSCVDRAKFGSTLIGMGTKIDNMCQIAHNCRIGRCCVIAGCTGIGGSVVIGDGVAVGGGVGISDHLTVGDRAQIGGMSFITKDIPAGQTWIGYPADRAFSTLRQWSATRKLPEILNRLEKSGVE